ncbi:MAG: ribosome-binding factor A [uncultured bacterium]|nr:MAG: ribosome-binding factor A [uncultured bacterium]OGT24534.1 MAG: ribosome-binding factor A [Gammaproteobacteria bacterium RIFCSPHIGHO2_12_38_15]
MARTFTRAQRVSELVHHALARLIQRELPSKEFGMITVTQVKVSAGLDHAKVYVTVLQEKKAKEALLFLEENNKLLRHLLSKTIQLRIAPQLKFYYDTSLNDARKLTQLIDEAVALDHDLHKDTSKN